MPWFRLFACGEDFPVILDNNVEVVGFYTTRYIEAETQGEAEALCSAEVDSVGAPAPIPPTLNPPIIKASTPRPMPAPLATSLKYGKPLVDSDNYSPGYLTPVCMRISSMVSMIETVSSRLITGLSVKPALIQRSTSSA